MNIFVLAGNPWDSAKMQCDKHVVKMPLETAQMLCSVWHRYGQGDKVPYKEAHKKHPCTLWAGDTKQNYKWLYHHGQELCAEYTRRYGRSHKCEAVIFELYHTPFEFDHYHETIHPQCMPDEYKHNDVITAYRNYYLGAKRDIAKWDKGRQAPSWFKERTIHLMVDGIFQTRSI